MLRLHFPFNPEPPGLSVELDLCWLIHACGPHVQTVRQPRQIEFLYCQTCPEVAQCTVLVQDQGN